MEKVRIEVDRAQAAMLRQIVEQLRVDAEGADDSDFKPCSKEVMVGELKAVEKAITDGIYGRGDD